MLAALLLFGHTALLGEPVSPEQHETTQTSFSYSTDPNTVVLFVAVMTTYVNRSFMLHGDGRLVVAQFGPDRKNIREHTLTLSPDERHELLQIAADYRLPEYDATNIRARQLRAKTDSGSGGVFHRETTLVNIALDAYTRDGQTTEDLYTQINVQAAKFSATQFPDIPEFQGIKILQDQLYGFWKKAGWELW